MDAETVGRDYLKDVDCPVINCVFTHNRDYLPSSTDYDAIIFHVGEAKNGSEWNEPRFRRYDQVYVMANKESPILTKRNLTLYNNFFNMTLTYRLDSDVLWSYGMVFDIETGAVVAPSKGAKWRKPEAVHDPKVLKLIKSKSKMATWFVSHCKAFSNRDLLAKRLQQFIDVDIYGKCGNPICPRDIAGTCLDMLNSTYKFYFAFENSICTDYMTEKVFLNMDNYVIPILYNGVTDMQHFLPPKSYINVNDFNSIKELANYLKFLDINPQEYANYFWWKKYYKIKFRPDNFTFCNMCVKLNEWRDQRKIQQYPDLDTWYNYQTCKDKVKDFV
ncbi:alpha-(1,3)-fucosyltransferase C-like [Chironomus tepperi]|uniref:alpha-(1,3)-fucosyltransferase C-like n=1 Tax=Chironomus tepperi TaxID=113505 RepID=UPI00391F16D7